MQDDNERHALATYVSDMLTLERHIRIPFDAQRNERAFAEDPDASQLLSRFAATSDQHIEQLKECLEDLGGREAAGMNSAFVSNGLRDDYTALALCAAGYTALIAAANAMGETSVAAIAGAMLENYASLILEIEDALPAAVVRELAASGIDIYQLTISATTQQIDRAWQTPSGLQKSTASPSRATIGSTGSAFARTPRSDR
jgi:ferritin-like metal-binding protein YciE